MKTLLTLAASASLCALCSAQEMFSNAGFENSLSGWINSSPGSLTAVSNNASLPAHGGSTAASFLGTVFAGQGSPVSLSQDTTMSLGQNYRLSFWLREGNAFSGGTKSFRVTANSATLFDLGSAAGTTSVGQTYRQYSVVFTATSSLLDQNGAARISFTGLNRTNRYLLDDVSLTPQAVPEPSVLAAFAIGSAWLRRKKRV